jgi:hypothetical protein
MRCQIMDASHLLIVLYSFNCGYNARRTGRTNGTEYATITILSDKSSSPRYYIRTNHFIYLHVLQQALLATRESNPWSVKWLRTYNLIRVALHSIDRLARFFKVKKRVWLPYYCLVISKSQHTLSRKYLIQRNFIWRFWACTANLWTLGL